ncbi:MAG: hypothetical protein JRJ16_12150 [Deltaproteobacteria bacterium]|nr:hypothetical protein [Deltaproteobacteria bacterium]
MYTNFAEFIIEEVTDPGFSDSTVFRTTALPGSRHKIRPAPRLLIPAGGDSGPNVTGDGCIEKTSMLEFADLYGLTP